MTLYLDNCCYNRPFDDQTQNQDRKQYDIGYGDYTKEKYTYEEENAEDIYAQLKNY